MSGSKNENQPKKSAISSELKETAKETGGELVCFLVSVVAPFVGLSHDTERGFHINVIKAVIWVVVLLVLLFGVADGNILMAYALTCVASVVWKILCNYDFI